MPATSGGLAAAEGAAFAGTAKGDVAILQATNTAESLAVFLHSAIVENFHS